MSCDFDVYEVNHRSKVRGRAESDALDWGAFQISAQYNPTNPQLGTVVMYEMGPEQLDAIESITGERPVGLC